NVTGGIGNINGTGFFKATNLGSGKVIATYGNLSGRTSVTVTPPKLRKIEVFPDQVEVVIGQNKTFIATCYDKHNNNISIEVDEWNVAGDIGTITKINATAALFTATKEGKGTINAINGSIIGSASITVTKYIPKLHHIEIIPKFANVGNGKNRTFIAIGYDKNNNTIPIEVEWNITGNIGTITKINATSALFTATKEGNGTVNAINGSIIGSASITVTKYIPKLHHIEIIPKFANVGNGKNRTFIAIGYDKNNNTIPIEVEWNITGNIGTITKINATSALFTATKEGNGTVNAIYGSINGSAKIIVPGPVHHLEIIPSNITVPSRSQIKFVALGRDKNNHLNNSFEFEELSWSATNVGEISSPEGILTTSVNKTNGTVEVWLSKYPDINGKTNVKVRVLKNIRLFPDNPTIVAGENLKFEVYGEDEYGKLLNLTQDFIVNKVTWNITSGIGEIKSRSIFNSTTSGEVQLNFSFLSLFNSTKITVLPSSLAYFEIEPENAVLPTSYKIKFKAIGKDRYGNKIKNLTEVLWSANGVGSISSYDGVLTTSPLKSNGTVTVRSGNITTSTNVTVVELKKPLEIYPKTPYINNTTWQFYLFGLDQDNNTRKVKFSNWSVNGEIGARATMQIGEIKENGLFTAFKFGNGSIVASLETGEYVEKKVEVIPNPEIMKLEITKKFNNYLLIGIEEQFKGIVKDIYGNTINVTPEWSIEGNIGTIDQNGLFKATKTGKGSIKAKYKDLRGTLEIIVHSGIHGDLNENGRVDVGDVAKVRYMALGKIPYETRADFDCDGIVDQKDSSSITFYLLRKIGDLGNIFDINQNCVVQGDSEDYQISIKKIRELINNSGYESRYDYNEDGVVNEYDMEMAIDAYLGFEKTYPSSITFFSHNSSFSTIIKGTPLENKIKTTLFKETAYYLIKLPEGFNASFYYQSNIGIFENLTFQNQLALKSLTPLSGNLTLCLVFNTSNLKEDAYTFLFSEAFIYDKGIRGDLLFPKPFTINITSIPIRPQITNYNNITKNNATEITVNESESIYFNATADQLIDTWNWYVNNTNISHNYNNLT
ncbi:MAG: hypothetical protein ACE5J3_04150, partial [Methanosarcinales archaeon]